MLEPFKAFTKLIKHTVNTKSNHGTILSLFLCVFLVRNLKGTFLKKKNINYFSIWKLSLQIQEMDQHNL